MTKRTIQEDLPTLTLENVNHTGDFTFKTISLQASGETSDHAKDNMHFLFELFNEVKNG